MKEIPIRMLEMGSAGTKENPRLFYLFVEYSGKKKTTLERRDYDAGDDLAQIAHDWIYNRKYLYPIR